MKDFIIKKYSAQFGSLPDIIVRSPGRVNIIGEHTDYNDGFVLPAAIDKAAYVALGLREDKEIHLYAADLNESFSIHMIDMKPVGDISWPNYLLGAAAQFAKIGLLKSGFNALVTSDIPIGAGLSSSAAVESAAIFALNELFQSGLPKMGMIKMAQLTEHEFAGVRCGITDMFASVILKDFPMVIFPIISGNFLLLLDIFAQTLR